MKRGGAGPAVCSDSTFAVLSPLTASLPRTASENTCSVFSSYVQQHVPEARPSLHDVAVQEQYLCSVEVIYNVFHAGGPVASYEIKRPTKIWSFDEIVQFVPEWIRPKLAQTCFGEVGFQITRIMRRHRILDDFFDVPDNTLPQLDDPEYYNQFRIFCKVAQPLQSVVDSKDNSAENNCTSMPSECFFGSLSPVSSLPSAINPGLIGNALLRSPPSTSSQKPKCTWRKQRRQSSKDEFGAGGAVNLKLSNNETPKSVARNSSRTAQKYLAFPKKQGVKMPPADFSHDFDWWTTGQDITLQGPSVREILQHSSLGRAAIENYDRFRLSGTGSVDVTTRRSIVRCVGRFLVQNCAITYKPSPVEYNEYAQKIAAEFPLAGEKDLFANKRHSGRLQMFVRNFRSRREFETH